MAKSGCMHVNSGAVLETLVEPIVVEPIVAGRVVGLENSPVVCLRRLTAMVSMAVCHSVSYASQSAIDPPCDKYAAGSVKGCWSTASRATASLLVGYVGPVKGVFQISASAQRAR
eukprot:scaffold202_cov180-Amphora_coffeaeformis.AAC.19